MERSVIDLWVGIFVASGIAALLFLALKAGNVDSIIKSEGYLVSANSIILVDSKLRLR
jgi:phospholipid/cholesterol/gamma-HCH transport system substrate-binding protein